MLMALKAVFFVQKKTKLLRFYLCAVNKKFQLTNLSTEIKGFQFMAPLSSAIIATDRLYRIIDPGARSPLRFLNISFMKHHFNVFFGSFFRDHDLHWIE